MNRNRVSSTAIAEFGYDARSLKLDVAFRHGGMYRYFDVPKTVYEEFTNADSKGRFFQENIRGQYRYLKIQS